MLAVCELEEAFAARQEPRSHQFSTICAAKNPGIGAMPGFRDQRRALSPPDPLSGELQRSLPVGQLQTEGVIVLGCHDTGHLGAAVTASQREFPASDLEGS